jgi:hypothetical protein
MSERPSAPGPRLIIDYKPTPPILQRSLDNSGNRFAQRATAPESLRIRNLLVGKAGTFGGSSNFRSDRSGQA